MTLGLMSRQGAPLLAVPFSLALHCTDAVPLVSIFLADRVAIAVLAD